MRILMLNNEFPPLGGGTGSVTRAILEGLSKVPGLEIDLITSAMGKIPERIRFARNIRIFRVPVKNKVIHHSSNRELITYAVGAFSLVRALHGARPYDFCFAWSGVPAGGVAFALHKVAGLRYLVRVGGPDIPGFERRYRVIYPVLKPIIRRIWHGAEIVIAKCEGEADMIRKVDSEVKVLLVPNGVDLDAFQPGSTVPEQGPLRIICVARLIERKGQNDLIVAVKRLTEEGVQVTLDLIGTGDAQASYEKLATALRVDDRVRFCGYIPREKIAAFYASAQVFVLPSYNEGMSVAALEAMSAGLPLVLTRTGGTSDLVEDGVNGWSFNWADVEGLTGHLRTLAMNRPLIRLFGAASRKRAARFSWDMAVKEYLAIFETLACLRTFPIAGISSSAIQY